MRTPKQTAIDLNDLTSAWARLAAEDTFAGYTLEQFKAVVAPSLAARARLEELRLDFENWLTARMRADEVSVHEYLRVILSIRCHAKHGNNSPILRACDYVLEMERESGLTRKDTTEEGAPPTEPPSTDGLPQAA